MRKLMLAILALLLCNLHATACAVCLGLGVATVIWAVIGIISLLTGFEREREVWRGFKKVAVAFAVALLICIATSSRGGAAQTGQCQCQCAQEECR